MCKYVMHFLLEKGMKIENTEGMIDAAGEIGRGAKDGWVEGCPVPKLTTPLPLVVAVFPINYFSARQINYFYDDAEETLGKYIGEELSI
jgi:hypothetical protein